MTIKSFAFLMLVGQFLSAQPDERRRACLDLRVLWDELDRGERISLTVLLAHVLVDEADPGVREEELYALATAANLDDLSPEARSLVRQRGELGLSRSELITWHDIVDEEI